MSASAAARSTIVVDRLSKTYHPFPGWMRLLVRTNVTRDVVALDDVSFSVGPGEICALVGPNGAGKTTTFRILVGLAAASSGGASVMGFDCEHQSLEVRRLVGWMPAEDRSLLMRLTAAENLYFHGRLQGLKGRDLRSRIADTLDLVGLGGRAESSVFALSAGMRARLQLARALLPDPSVLILDEPTGSVDPVAAHELLGVIMTVVEERGLAALLSSHRLEEIEALGSRVVLLDRGRVRFDGDLESLRRTWDRPRFEIGFVSPQAAREAATRLDAAGIGEPSAIRGAAVECLLGAGTELGGVLHSLGDALSGVTHLHELRTPLRDVLAHMYGEDRPAEEEPAV